MTNNNIIYCDGSLYPTLKKYEKNRIVKYEKDMRNEPPGKPYKLLEKGRVEMEIQMNNFKELAGIINTLYVLK